jgi:TDG/mug DNA glycosylase family protein
MDKVRDIIAFDLKILFIGFNPGMRSAETGHHFAGYSNRFWKLLSLAGLTPRQLKPEEDILLLQYGFGITNIVDRPTRAAAEITKEEYREGRLNLQAKLELYQPKVAAYAGIGVYQEFAKLKSVVCGAQQVGVVAGIIDFVLPSPSGLNRMILTDQLAYYQQLFHLAQSV